MNNKFCFNGICRGSTSALCDGTECEKLKDDNYYAKACELALKVTLGQKIEQVRKLNDLETNSEMKFIYENTIKLLKDLDERNT